jgi:polynucleotide 5'-hydroxyl-kinase GRC3/NOL9
MFVLSRLIEVLPDTVLLVKGPASVYCSGNATVLGKEIKDEIIVRAGKILPFETNELSKIKIRIYKDGGYRIAKDGDVGVSIWKDAARKMFENRRRVMLVGATDTGKSTLTAYLSNIAQINGLKVGVIDGDVGQGDLAPPGCIGAALIKEQFLDLRDIDTEYYGFIGNISPMGMENLVIGNIKQILDKIAASADTCIVNTDGYLDKDGIDYKIALAKTIKPDLIICIGFTSKKFEDFEVVRVNAPRKIMKTRAEREERRLVQYARFLGNGKQIFEIKDKNFMFMGKVCELVIFRDRLIRLGNAIMPSDILRGMFVGLAIGSDVREFGVITGISSGRIAVKTSYEGEFDTIMLSTIGISRNMRMEYRIPLVANR